MTHFLGWLSVGFLIVGLVFVVLGSGRFQDEEKSLKRLFLGGLSFFVTPVIISIVLAVVLYVPVLSLIFPVIELILMVPLLVGFFVIRKVKTARITTIIGVVIGLLQLLIVCAFFSWAGVFPNMTGDYKYQEVAPGQIAITEYLGQETQVVIPPVIDNKSVTGVISLSGTGDRRRIEMIKSITIPDSVTSIGDRAFSGCESLTEITIPDSVTSIGDGAFSNCTSLKRILVSSGNSNYISLDGVLYTKDGKTLVAYPSGKGGAFVIPDTVTQFANHAFSGAQYLTDIKIPNGVTGLSEYMFSGCDSLTKITIPDSVTRIEDRVFSWCTMLKEITLPEGLIDIGTGAFEHSGLSRITIPASVTNIGPSAFERCYDMMEIIVSPKNPNYSSKKGLLYNKDRTNLITCPCGISGSLTLPQGLKSIDWRAFDDCKNITDITIPEGVTSIGDSAFSGCESLKSISIPDSVTDLGYSNTFFRCTSLTSITIPEGVTSIGDSAFSSCESLTEITIPEGVTSIGDGAFRWCESLTEITIPEGVISIGEQAFMSCTALTNITIPDSVTSIADNAFDYCDQAVIRCSKDSFAYKFASKKAIKREILE